MAGRLDRRDFLRGVAAMGAAAACPLAAGARETIAAPAGLPAVLGGGNVNVGRDLEKAGCQYRVLKDLGAGMCRIPVSEGVYFSPQEKKPLPERCDEVVLLARKHDVTPVFLFEYYTRWNRPLGGRDRWHAIGRAFAERFSPGSPFLESRGVRDWGVRVYTAINEPTWKSNNPLPIPPDEYAAALEGLADGVHSVSPGLRASPGGYIEGSLHGGKDAYVRAAAPLFNAGKLWSLDIHRYWDVKYVPMEGTYRHSLQNQFDEVKRDYGITRDIRFHTTEMNFKKREISEEEAAKGFLTALWDALGVVGNDGRRANEFVFPWNIFNTADKDDHYGLCTRLEPWTPTARGKVLRLVCRLARGMEFASCRPRGPGEFLLEGGGRRLRVWQNRKAWTDRPGTAFEVADIPAGAGVLEVYRWNSWEAPWRSFDVAGKTSFAVTGLEPGETFMFLARPAA